MVSANRLLLAATALAAGPASVSAGVTVRMLQSGQCGESQLDNRLIAGMAIRMTSGLESGNCADVGFADDRPHMT